ncbi:MAG: SDR family NAD(P)-dependent oxidoreductase [Pyrinomonadaceae bacterium]|nr:SDR family NAD(P)-dependent oxidoreductase [Pyrinomonadaceae bacterium]
MVALVTGAGGFIGSCLVERLLRQGHKVRALAHYNSRGSWGHLDGLDHNSRENLEVRLGDVTDPYLVRDLVAGCDIVFHLAALIGIPYSYHAPASYVATNINGTLNILEACRQGKTRRVIVTSTSEVYGTARYAPIDEAHPLQGQSPYSASKIAADKLAESFFCSFDLPVVILRPFNTYGPRQSARAIIPTVLTQALAGENQIHLGNLEPRRDLTFVEDTAQAFLLAATAPNIEGETIHFGQGREISVRDLAVKCLKVVASEAEIVSSNDRHRPERSEVGLLLCDAAKARRLLGWEPKICLDEGLRRTTEYLRAHLAQYRTKDYLI